MENIKRYLITEQGFQEKDMLILMDDGRHHEPTRKNITDAFQRICQYSQPNDVVFVHYSGHGKSLPFYLFTCLYLVDISPQKCNKLLIVVPPPPPPSHRR